VGAKVHRNGNTQEGPLVLSTIGLVLDLIGALVLARGLFRGPVSSTYGLPIRSLEDVAADRAYGVVGGGFLIVGFCLQVVANILHTGRSSAEAKIGAAAATLVGGTAVAVGLWRVLDAYFLRQLGGR
jgi:hypothetical protein